jgi:AcrR family transcriptional regulator
MPANSSPQCVEESVATLRRRTARTATLRRTLMTDRRTHILEAAARQVAKRGVRGLRIEELAEDAGVSQGLLYYYFGDRAGLLQQTFFYVNERAGSYTEQAAAQADSPRRELELLLLLEFQDDPTVIENSMAWGELRASAKFEPELQQALRESTADWVTDIAAAVERARGSQRPRPRAGAIAAAERLTSLVEGLSERWLSKSMSLERAQKLLDEAVSLELARLNKRR